jgi:cholesterol oxidase
MSLWPNRGEIDSRPPLGAGYERMTPVQPRDPIVPDTAPAALRNMPVDLGMPDVRTA